MTAIAPQTARTCFFEDDVSLQLGRRAFAEGIGTLMLMVAIAGASLIAEPLSKQQPLIALAVGAVATGGALASLIIALGPVSGGHFNPIITGLQCLGGERSLGCTLAYVAAQILGALAGSWIAGILVAAGTPTSGTQNNFVGFVSEIVATAGLMLIVFGCARGRRPDVGPFAVGAWLIAGIVATPSTSYANPAVVLAAITSGGPVHLSSQTALSFLVAEIIGGLAAFAAITLCYPRTNADIGGIP